MKKLILSIALIVVCTAAPAIACNPNPALMQDECYSSCANQALLYYDQCTTSCSQTWCYTEMGTPKPCEQPAYDTCMGRCSTEKCNNLQECEDYCHEW